MKSLIVYQQETQHFCTQLKDKLHKKKEKALFYKETL
jgi:hypothetical protein